MESPVVLDKPPEYHGSERGFPFDEDEGSGAWSELASRHPDIAARLRQRPATWARKRRPSSQDATDDFGDSFGGFDRFPFDDIPPEFREHFPSHWNRRFGPRDEQPQPQQTQQHAPQSPPAQQQTAATQTEQEPQAGPSEPEPQAHLPQYGLRNTVDLGQKSPADPSLVDADDRNQRSMSAPPDSSAPPNQSFKMSGQNHQEQHQPQHGEQHSNVRHIPIFVEGRDEPVINKSVDHGTHFGDAKPAYVPPPQQPHIDREQYFADDSPGYHHPPNFTRAFGTPFNKGFRQGPQPFTQQKAYPQAAFARGASPQRSQSPKPHPHPHAEEHFVKVPVHHDQSAPKTEPPSRPQQRQQPQQQPPPQQKQPPPPQQAPQREQTPPQPKQTPANDPITQILRIQTDVLNLMTEVENFGGTKNDKKYLFLDEMLTRNLIKLDTIETDGKENIRQARKEAIKCIQKCIAVLEAKAESNANGGQSQPQPQDVEMKENTDAQQAPEQVTENGEVEMKDSTKEEAQVEQAEKPAEVAPAQEAKTESTEAKVQDDTVAAAPVDNKDVTQTEAADTRPEATPSDKPAETTEQKEETAEKSPKKGTKVVKKRNKSKDNKKDVPNDSNKQEAEDSNKEEKVEDKKEKLDIMQVDDKGDKVEPQVMEVDGAASQ
ncbi:BAG domain-containing protein Samui isoform X1 [Helicoverpa armigera]|uniref:BAG domain-containing protein Samui isoform X1 n=1 Tax=Helicoverpa armigera TaxID=29058 RepID=UPI003082BAEC